MPCVAGTRYTGHTLAKYVVTIAIGILTGLFYVALSKSVGALIGWKLGILQTTLTGEEGEEYEGGTSFGRIVAAFFKYWLFGGVLVTIATAMVGGRGCWCWELMSLHAMRVRASPCPT